MLYNKDNIKGLVVKRGGGIQYTISHVWSDTVEMKYISSSGRRERCSVLLNSCLKYLSTGKWDVISPSVEINSYEIY